MITPSDETTAKRRKVRKGTHSCWECKRRKVKCNFASPHGAICINCHQRNTKCVSQEVIDGSDAAENNWDNTGLTEQAPSWDQPPDTSGGCPRTEHVAGSCAASAFYSALPTPMSTLLCRPLTRVPDHRNGGQTEQSADLPMTPQLSPAPGSGHPSRAESHRHTKITQTLICAFPSQVNIEILLREVANFSMLGYHSKYRSHPLMRKETPNEEYSLLSPLDPNSHPVLLARQMLLLATALQHIPRNQVVAGLTEHHYAIIDRLTEAVIRSVTTNDTLLGTLEGFENIILEAIFHTVCGNIRRAWVTTRRAVMAGQLLGLHRAGQCRFKVINEPNDLDPAAMWACTVSIERVMSLLLGLPTSTATVSSGVPVATNTSAPEYSILPTIVTDVAASILARNEIHEPRLALEMTRKINRELLQRAERIPSTFWRPTNFAKLEMASEDAFWESQRSWDLMLYFTLLNQLHLPYMLHSSDVSQIVYSRIACVNASREVLTREIAMRTFSNITACGRMGDFMALIAGMALILAHLMCNCDNEMDNLFAHQRSTDRAIVERALECMKSMSEVSEDLLAAKCATLLKHLLAIEEDSAQKKSYHAHKPPCENGDHDDKNNVLVIQVPYVGALRITRGGITSMLPSDVPRHQGRHEDVTIGGLGSLHVHEPRLVDPGDVVGRPDARPQQAAATQEVEAPFCGLGTPDNLQVASEELFVQQDELFPDASASIDDWVFQGLDTAFFDVLMRGAGEQQFNDAVAEECDFDNMQ